MRAPKNHQVRTNYPLLARPVPNKLRREKKKQRRQATDIVWSDDQLRSLLGIILHRLWLYAGNTPQYQVQSLTLRCQPIIVEREGFTQYYR